MEYRDLVKKHYQEEAKKKGLSLNNTMADLNTRRLEIENISSYLKDDERCLDVGCGNAGASIKISKIRKLDLTCIDFSSDMIALAKKQPIKGIRGEIRFQEGDVLEMKFKNYFDSVFTERCIINLLTWNDQKKALKNMVTALKKDGKLILLEAFSDGLKELNEARQEVSLPPILPAYHNLHLNKDLVIKYLTKQDLVFKAENNFLSSYYFGSRVFYPALAKINKKEIKYNSNFVKYFSFLPSYGNYSYIKILLFKKIK